MPSDRTRSAATKEGRGGGRRGVISFPFMSWDADVYLIRPGVQCPECGHLLKPASEDRTWLGSWNYTHNTNGMIAAAYEAVTGAQTEQCDGPLGPAIGAAWWRRLDDANGDEGRKYLSEIITGLEADPVRFRAMNPENGWGDYDRLLDVLREMRDAVPAGDDAKWEVSG